MKLTIETNDKDSFKFINDLFSDPKHVWKEYEKKDDLEDLLHWVFEAVEKFKIVDIEGKLPPEEINEDD
jgi:hypothetical protein